MKIAASITMGEVAADVQAVEAERKTVIPLFADIKGSTELMEDLDSEEAHAFTTALKQSAKSSELQRR